MAGQFLPTLAAALGTTLLTCATACSDGPLAGRAMPLPCPAGSTAPRLASLDGRLVLSWIEKGGPAPPSLRFARRDGTVWTAPSRVVADLRLEVDTADVPGVVPLEGGGLAAFWSIKHGDDPYARDLMVATSRDDGATWTQPVRPHRDATVTEHGMASLVPARESGRFGIAWLDGRVGEESSYGEGGTALFWADWNGAAFDPEVVLDPRVCDCCKTAAAAAPDGPIVAYRDRGAAERRDIGIVRETGGRWSEPRTVHADGWALQACPTNGPAVAASGARAVVAWFTGAAKTPSVWAALSHDGGSTFSAPIRIDEGRAIGRVESALLPDGSAAVVWMERKGERAEVRVRRIAPGGESLAALTVARTGASRASGYPRVAAAGDRDVLVVWTDTTGPASRVSAAEVTLP
jgi:hypothetical protein